jgi:hypothetical protein
MSNKFKYDYNNKMFFINLTLSIIFLILSIVSFEKVVAFILCLIMTILELFNSFFLIMTQGIRITKGKIVIVDQLLIRKICLDDIRYVSLKQIQKESRNKVYGFFNEFFLPDTYMSHCDYVYNQGRVYNICFHMTDGTIKKSYFGWLYREKREKVEKVEKQLIEFIEKINVLCIENRKN